MQVILLGLDQKIESVWINEIRNLLCYDQTFSLINQNLLAIDSAFYGQGIKILQEDSLNRETSQTLLLINRLQKPKKNAPEHCLDIILKKNVFKLFSSLDIGFGAHEILNEYRIHASFDYIAVTFKNL